MKCYLYSKERRQRDGKPDFFVCKWVGIIGDANAEKSIEHEGVAMLNIAAVQARQINLTKSIFPVTDEEVPLWNKTLKSQITVTRNEDGTAELKVNKDKEGNPREPKDCVWTNLLYIQVPLAEISDKVRKIRFENSQGKVITQSFITVIGIADVNDKWAETQTADEMAKANLATNLANGVYLDVTDEEDNDELEAKMPSKERRVDLKGATEDEED